MKESEQSQTDDVVKELQSKIEALRNENRLLKERLDEAEISYADIVPDNGNEHTDISNCKIVEMCVFAVYAADNGKRRVSWSEKLGKRIV